MKRKNFLLNLLAMMMVAMVSVGFTSCSDDDKEEALPVIPQTNKVTVKNNSTYSLYRFRVVFVNSRMEEIDDKDFGTREPGKSISCEIPTGATEYYMATYQNYTWFFSPNYEVSYKNISLTNSIINNWYSNSSSNRYPKACSTN